MQPNSLYFGDNLKVLSERLPDGTYVFPSESVDLVYLDPPFNSNRDYNLIFKETSGQGADARIRAFEDTWHWDATARDTYEDLTTTAVADGRVPPDVGALIDSLVRAIGHNDMSAYLVMMTPRLVQLHRVLKPTGSLYLHCDPTASHYLKIVLDAVFGPEHFRNEISWKRTTAHSSAKKWAPLHDVILYYGRTRGVTWNAPRKAYEQAYLDKYYRFDDGDGRLFWRADLAAAGTRQGSSGQAWRGIDIAKKGMHWKFTTERLDELDAEGRIYWPPKGTMPQYKRYRDELKGIAIPDFWDDIDRINPVGSERLGYPTQKPVALLERIIDASSNEGDVVLDPFCGCGTALIAAEKLKRQWVGIDVTHLSIAVMRSRLMDSFGLADVPVHGVPADLESARMLAAESKDGRYEFQWWALARIDAKPLGGERKKGADRGIDGVMTFSEHDSIQRILVSVKSGKPSLLHVKELIATLETEKGAIGVLLELDDPTSEMERAALEAGQYASELWGAKFDRIQILTVAELLAGKKPNVPKFMPAYQKAARIAAEAGQQQALWDAAQAE